MDSLVQKTHTTSRSYTYAYYVKLSTTKKPTLLFTHGFPDNAHLWTAQVSHFLALGYGCIVPDCLGYGGSSKPADLEAYNAKGMADDMVEILDTEKVDRAVLVGHDWGVLLTARIPLWHPERVLGSIFLAVPYIAPAEADLDAMLALTKEHFGYEAWA
jgi:soluble epoxide hydrolase / lipid-phosphate phosphatase